MLFTVYWGKFIFVRYAYGGPELNKAVLERRRIIFAMAVPIMIQNIVQHVMILFDRGFLGNLDARYLAAVGNVMPIFNAFMFFTFSIGTGLTVLVAQNIGAKEYKKAQRFGESAFFFFSLLSVILFLIWFFGAESIFTLFGAQGDILSFASRYAHILSFLFLFLGIDVTAGGILMGIGITRPIMVFGIIKSLVNIVLDWALIFGRLGLPAMGLEGAALATVVATAIGALGILITSLVMRGLPFRLSKRALLRPDWHYFQHIWKVGLPSGLEGFLWSSGQLVIVYFLNQIDGMAIGVYSLVIGIQILALFVYQGFAKSAMTLVGQRWGEGDRKAALDTALHCQRLTLTVSIACGLLFLSFPAFLAGLFTKDAGVVARAVPLLRLSGVYIQFQAVNVIMGHAIRGTGDTKWMMYSQIFGTVFVIGVSYLLIFQAGLGLIGMYLTMIMDELSRGAVNTVRFLTGRNPFKKSVSFEAEAS